MGIMEHTIKEIIADELGLLSKSVTENSSLVADLRADSLSIVTIIIALEEKFDVKFDDKKVKDLKTVVDVIKYVKDKILSKNKKDKFGKESTNFLLI